MTTQQGRVLGCPYLRLNKISGEELFSYYILDFLNDVICNSLIVSNFLRYRAPMDISLCAEWATLWK